jgi:hypothetical protein
MAADNGPLRHSIKQPESVRECRAQQEHGLVICLQVWQEVAVSPLIQRKGTSNGD